MSKPPKPEIYERKGQKVVRRKETGNGIKMAEGQNGTPPTEEIPEPAHPTPMVQPPVEHQSEGDNGMENGDMDSLAKKINQAIQKGKVGLDLPDSHRVELGNAIFNTVFAGDLGVLEAHRLFAPYYQKKHPQYKTYVDNWAKLITKTKELRKEADSVREWRAIEQKLRLFYRSQAVDALARERGYHKAIIPQILIELQRERYHIEVIEQCIQQVNQHDLTEVQTRNLRKQLSKSYRRGKRLEKATVVHRRVDNLIDSLNWALDDESISFRDLARLDSADREQLVSKLSRLEERLTEARTLRVQCAEIRRNKHL